MKALKNQIIMFAAIMATLIIASIGVIAASDPNAPQTLTQGTISTFDEGNYPAQQTNALAGNITQITLQGISQTRAWQGYWGNVSGYITLDDANNFTFYNWSAAEPRGQIYASLVSLGTPDWANVVCGISGAGTNNAALNFQSEYGIVLDDYDNVTITYSATNHPDFQIIDTTITGCPTTYIWQSDASQTSNFVNFLLFDSTDDQNDSWIFGTTIENKDVGNKTDRACYNGQLCDFQLLVAEDGHGTDTAPTPYYFWVDLIG